MNVIIRKIKRVIEAGREDGYAGIKALIDWNLIKLRSWRRYEKWLQIHGHISSDEKAGIIKTIKNFREKPLISIVMPVYNVDEKWLRLCIESVLKQLYTNWELCIADDCSPGPHIRSVLEEFSARDRRIKVVYRAENGHISAASNSALEIATGRFVVLLDHDDELAEDALFWVAKEINDFPECEMIYSDEDMMDETGRRFGPKFKPDWSRDFFYSLNLITHLSGYRTELLRKVGGFRIGLEGSQDYDLALRVIEEIDESKIRHIPRILYHWRAIAGSVALDSDEKPYAHERAREAIRSHFERTGKSATVIAGACNLHRVKYELPPTPPSVAAIISPKDGDQIFMEKISSLMQKTVYDNVEYVIVTSEPFVGSDRARNCRKIRCDKFHNSEKYNYAVSNAEAEIICFVDNDAIHMNEDWLEDLVRYAIQNEIGAVGGKILKRDGTILHAGYILGAGGLVGSAHRGFPRHDGYFLRAQLTNNFSAVSAACMAVRRELFLATGGFDAVNLPDSLYDVDFCLRLREMGYRIVFTPYAELIKNGVNPGLIGQKTPSPAESAYFSRKWAQYIEKDPFYNPNLSRKDASFSIAV